MSFYVKCPACGDIGEIHEETERSVDAECSQCGLMVRVPSATIGVIIGKIPKEIRQSEDEISFMFDDGSSCVFFHEQDCCEDVRVEDVNGDWYTLIGSPILIAEEKVSGETSQNAQFQDEEDSCTWTFYTFRSIKGSVDVRWFGSSNGYYSEAVDIMFCPVKEL